MNLCDIDNIVVAGKSGAGKQPRIDVLVAEGGLRQLSTGNIFREYLGAYNKLGFEGRPDDFRDGDGFVADERILAALKALCESAGVDPAAALLGFKAACFVNEGRFVPDSLTNELFAAAFKRASGRKLALDGYPRTPAQARYLLELAAEVGTRIDLVLLVENDDEAIVARTVGRRICSSCGKVYHLEYKPPRDGRRCTACEAEVIQRSDDTEAKIRKRLEEFQTKARPALEVLERAGVPVARVAGNLPVFTEEAVRHSVLAALEEGWR